MSDERTADRPGYLCAAYGCPMIGSMSSSTAGGDFMCVAHYRKDQAKLQAITFEVNRNEWLARAIRDIRARSHNPGWRKTCARIKQDLADAGRADLAQKNDSMDTWMIRLEVELMTHVKAMLDQSQDQQPLDMGEV